MQYMHDLVDNNSDWSVTLCTYSIFVAKNQDFGEEFPTVLFTFYTNQLGYITKNALLFWIAVTIKLAHKMAGNHVL